MKLAIGLLTSLSDSCLADGARCCARKIDLTRSGIGTTIALGIFIVAYMLVMGEKSSTCASQTKKPVARCRGIIWILIGAVYTQQGMQDAAENGI